jgi:hypothetical protein
MKPWKFWLVLLVACAALPLGGFLTGQMSGTWAIVAFCVGIGVVIALKVSDALRTRKQAPKEDLPRFDTTEADVIELDEQRPKTVDGDDLPPAA